MSIRISGLAALVAALLLATGSSQAAYTLTGSGLNPTSATFGGTIFSFTAVAGPQSGTVASDFKVMDVTVTSTTVPPASDSGSVTLSENFSLTGDPGTMSFTLTGTFNLLSGSSGGVLSTYAPIISNIVGSGYTVAFGGYAPPTPNSTAGGDISLIVVPLATVPEPASVAMLGLGLLSVGGVALRRRMAK